MNRIVFLERIVCSGIVLFMAILGTASAQYPGWEYSGLMYVITTPEGADLPATAVEEDFPLLVRLHTDFFDFSQAKDNGQDIRFSVAGKPLAYQIEEWNPANGTAAIWVRIPVIKGNSRQAIKLHWGKTDAVSESKGSSVFNKSNGYVSVIHMNDPLTDELAAVALTDNGTSKTAAIIGEGRRFAKDKGINCGDHIKKYPYSNSPFTSEAWFRAGSDATGSHILYWGRYANRYNGKTGDGNEVGLSIASPPRLVWASDGPAGAGAKDMYTFGSWTHVAAVYGDTVSQIYVNGILAETRKHGRPAMSIVQDVCMNIGGWRGGNYTFVGDIDEVRVSNVARSADWMKLQFENQKELQTLVGPLLKEGSSFAVSQKNVSVWEGKTTAVTAQADGAQKIYWIQKRDGVESIVAVDRLTYVFDAGRVTADTPLTIQLKAVYPTTTKTIDIPVTIIEDVPEPIVTLKVPKVWDGRQTIEILPRIVNQKQMQAKDAGELTYTWTVSNVAVIKEITPGKLTLKRAQGNGNMTVTVEVSNGGTATVATTAISVTQPARDHWVQRIAATDEKPKENQFYARDDKNEGTLFYNGNLDQGDREVFLTVYADDVRYTHKRQKVGADKAYAFTVKLKPGLITYKVEFGTYVGTTRKVLHSVGNLVCGDAYIIQGQSNAEASGPNNGNPPESDFYTSKWIRSYGNYHGGNKGDWGTAVRTHKWGTQGYGNWHIGAWGIILAKNLLEQHRMPICIMNGAVGGTRIDQHQRNEANPTDSNTIYGRLLARIQAARLTHGIRGVLWHQGENNSGAASPTGDWDYKSYQQYFVDMSAAWKQDYPNIQHYYVFQVWPLPCNMGPKDDELRNVQRCLPLIYSNLTTMSTLGILSGSSGRGLCHFDLEGYAQMANLITPLVSADNYGTIPTRPVTAPNLQRARFTSASRNEITLDFGQPMEWGDEAKNNIYLDGVRTTISEGRVSGQMIILKLTAPSNARDISYLSGRDWNGMSENLIFGANGIAALTFCNVEIERK